MSIWHVYPTYIRLVDGSHIPLVLMFQTDTRELVGGTVAEGRAESLSLKAILEDEFHVPVKWVETRSRDTRENAANAAPILKAAGIEPE